jgi:transcriptional regulator with XRE-family HTH domain
MRIKELLKEKGMTAKELAAKLGMTETGLGIAIGEKGNPPLRRLYEIADTLNVPITELFDKPTEGNFACPHCGAALQFTVHLAT